MPSPKIQNSPSYSPITGIAVSLELGSPGSVSSISANTYSVPWRLLSLLFAWYATSVIATKMNYVTLALVSSPVSLSLFQHSFVAAFGLFVLKSLKHPLPSLSRSQILETLLPISAALACLSMTYNAAMLFISVSFINTIKSTVPFWTCLICTMYLNETYSWKTYLTLVPIVSGIALASYNETSFNLFGFIIACTSAVSQTVYNLLMKNTLKTNQIAFDSSTLLVYACAGTSLLLFPISVLHHLFDDTVKKFTLESVFSESIQVDTALVLLVCGINYYCEMSFAVRVIDALGPLGYSVADVFRRLVVIIASIVIFGNSISTYNALGIVVSMVGVLAYNVLSVPAKDPKEIM